MSRFELLDPPSVTAAAGGGALAVIPIDHVGIVVHDVDAAAARYGSTFGVTEWSKFSWESDVTWRGERVRSGGTAAIASLGPIRVELAQPTIGRFLMSEWLERNGESVFHLGYLVDDLPAVLERVARAGWGVDLLCEDDQGPEYAYLDADPAGGVHVELVAARLTRGGAPEGE